MKIIKNPALLYMGGKFLLSDWIISNFPPHKKYVEDFSGAASILFQKTRSKMEIINDLNSEIVNFFMVVRDTPEELYKTLLLTPYSREEYFNAYDTSECSCLEKARRTIVKSWFGIGSNSICQKSGFREYSKGYTYAPKSFSNFMDNILLLSSRLRNVIVESKPGIELIKKHNEPDTLHYLDPPYLHTTRTTNKKYNYEMSADDHEELLNTVLKSGSRFAISGYDNEMYNDMLIDFIKTEKETTTFLQEKRTEVLWISKHEQRNELF